MNDADFLAWMDREGIHKIARWPGRRVSVEMQNGDIGTALTVAAALAIARTGRENVRRIAA